MPIYRIQVDVEYDGDVVPEEAEEVADAVLEVIDPSGIGDAARFWSIQGFDVTAEYDEEQEVIPG